MRNKPCGGRYRDIVQSIGNTPLVELPGLSPKPAVRVWAKLEGANPTRSVKDRVARALIEDAEERGALEPGKRILEPTSGNTGISLAMICARKGYELTVVMPENVTPERSQLIEMYGARIVYSEGEKGSNGAVEKALDMAAKDPGCHMPYQYGNQANPGAHYNGTAVEILDALDDVAAFVAGLGTGGTLMGCGRRLKETFADAVKIVAAEPMPGEPVQGLRSLDEGFIPPIIDLSVLDRKIFVTNADSIAFTRKLLREDAKSGASTGELVPCRDGACPVLRRGRRRGQPRLYGKSDVPIGRTESDHEHKTPDRPDPCQRPRLRAGPKRCLAPGIRAAFGHAFRSAGVHRARPRLVARPRGQPLRPGDCRRLFR